MASRSSATGTLSVAFLIALSTASPAIAQAPTEIDSITVVAPRITYQIKREGGGGSGKGGSILPAEVSVAEKSALVKYGDLDLSRTADLYTLEDRVSEAATRVCEELAQQFPDGTPSTAVCTRRAVEDAMEHVQQTARMANRPQG